MREKDFTPETYILPMNYLVSIFPEQEKNMRKALQYVIEPINDINEILLFLSTFGEWLIERADDFLNTIDN